MTPKMKDAVFGLLKATGNIIVLLVVVWALWPLLYMFANDGVRP